MDRVDAPKRPGKLPTPVREDEMHAVSDALKRDYREKRKNGDCRAGSMVWAVPVIRFTFYTGLRASEIARLRWKDIDAKRGVIRLRDTKSGDTQTVPLISPAERALSDAQRPRGPECYVWRAPSSPLRERHERAFGLQCSRRWRWARELTDVSDEKTFHDLRAGFATKLADEGLSAHAIKRACRHAHMKTTLKYVRCSEQRLRSDMEGAFN